MLNPETSWFFDFKLEPTMCVTRQNMQWYCYCTKMLRTTIRQRWSVIAFNRTGIRAPSILRRLGIPRRTVYGILSRHAARPNEVRDLPRSGRPRKGMCQQWLQTGLSWHYGGLTAQKYTDHIIGPHNHGTETEIRYQDPSALPWSKMATATTGKDVYTAISTLSQCVSRVWRWV